MLRSTIAQADEPAYCVCWGGGSSSGQLLFCSGSNVTTAALQGTGGIGAGSRNSCGAHASWKAHDALVLTADWNVATNLIVTGAEDCKYKVWLRSEFCAPHTKLGQCQQQWATTANNTCVWILRIIQPQQLQGDNATAAARAVPRI